MIARATADQSFVLLTGVPWDTYQRFAGALGRYRLRHAYDRGKLELRKDIRGVTWDDYRAMLKALGDFHLRHIYDQGYLLFMSPLQSHDWVKRMISRFLESLAYDQQIPIKSIGSTTITSSAAQRGFEADEAYYVANEPKVRGKLEFEPDVDPPPDLILEVDVTTSSIDQLELYSALQVPEVWIHDGKSLQFLTRNRRGKYVVSKNSQAFPFLSPQDIETFLNQHADMDETTLTRNFVAHARQVRDRWTGKQRQAEKSPRKSSRRTK